MAEDVRAALATWAQRKDQASANDAWQPVHYQLDRSDDRLALGGLVESGAVRFVHDTVAEQLRELVAARDPRKTWPRHELDRRVAAHLAERGGQTAETWGTWIYFPWSARLVHVLPRDEYREVRTDRNRYKITRDEQQCLGQFRIGVIGLSVGNMAAVTLALEGIGGSFKIADFDQLSLSNLNRLRGGVHELGVDKTVLAAREMFEIDPYLKIERYPQGVQPDSIDAFLIEGGKLDLLIEECDDLYVKVAVRERARAHGIAVVMDTSDRGLLDIERFDREPDRPIFHGLLGSVRAEDLRGLETKEKVPFFLAIVDEMRMSTRMAASLPEIKHTISTWPQLASGVALGGAITADAARRILLGTHTESGRYYVDPSAIVATGQGTLRQPAPPPRPAAIALEALAPPAMPPAPRPGAALDRATVRWLLAQGTLAPSAHNAQPWRFRFAGDRLQCWHDPARDLPSLDFQHGATWLAFGALCENIALAARSIGWAATATLFPDAGNPRLVAALSFASCAPETDPLFPAVVTRVTNRRRGSRAPLSESSSRALEQATADASAGARLQLVHERPALDELGALMGACDRICLLNPAIHHDAMHGYRWTPEKVLEHRDGLDVATMEMTASDRAGLLLLQQWRVPECLAQIGGGRALEDVAVQTVASASAVGLVTVPGTDGAAYFQAGRAVQRLWLTATTHALALHPMTGLPYLFARLERGGGEGLAPHEQRQLAQLRDRYRRLFDTSTDRAEAFLFRLSLAEAPTARSLRRPLDDLLVFD